MITFLSDDVLEAVIDGKVNNGVGNLYSHGTGALPNNGDMGTGNTGFRVLGTLIEAWPRFGITRAKSQWSCYLALWPWLALAGWRWSVKRDHSDKAGTSYDREDAIKKARQYIDNLLRRHPPQIDR